MTSTQNTDPVAARLLGAVLVLVIAPVMVLWATNFSPLLSGEGGGTPALSSSDPQYVEATARAVQDAIIAAFIALSAVGFGAGGLIVLVRGAVGSGTRVLLKLSALALLFGIVAGPVFEIDGTPATGPSSGPSP